MKLNCFFMYPVISKKQIPCPLYAVEKKKESLGNEVYFSTPIIVCSLQEFLCFTQEISCFTHNIKWYAE